MNLLKKCFPFSFGLDTVGKLVLFVILYVVVGAVLNCIPVLGQLCALYCTTGIVLAFLSYFKLIK